MSIVSWFCEICKNERTDELIGVVSAFHLSDGAKHPNFARNVKFCRDKEICFHKALQLATDSINDLNKRFKNFYPEGKLYRQIDSQEKEEL